MAELLGLGASIIAVLTLTKKVVSGLRTLANGMGTAGLEVQSYSSEINDFAVLLERTQKTVQQATSASLTDHDLLKDLLEVCERVMDPLNLMQRRLNRYDTSFRQQQNRRKIRHFHTTVKWLFSTKQKIMYLRSVVQGQHRLLDTLLQLMVFRSLVLQPRIDASRRSSQQHILQESLAEWAISRSRPASTDDYNASHRTEQVPQSPLSEDLTLFSQSTMERYNNHVTGSLPRPGAPSGSDGLSEEEFRTLERDIDEGLGPASRNDPEMREVEEELRFLARKSRKRVETFISSIGDGDPFETMRDVSSTGTNSRRVSSEGQSLSLHDSRKPGGYEPSYSSDITRDTVHTGDITMTTSDELRCTLPKDMIRSWQELKNIMKSAFTSRRDEIEQDSFQVFTAKGLIVAEPLWQMSLAQPDFKHAYIIFNSIYGSDGISGTRVAITLKNLISHEPAENHEDMVVGREKREEHVEAEGLRRTLLCDCSTYLENIGCEAQAYLYDSSWADWSDAMRPPQSPGFNLSVFTRK